MTILLVVLIFVLLSAVFSGTETAFTSLNPIELERKAQDDRLSARLIRVLQNPQRFLSTVLVGNNITNIASASLMTAAAIDLWGEDAVPYAAMGLTLFILLFAEILPKSIASIFPEPVSRIMLPFVLLVEWLFLPLILLTSGVARVMFWVLRIPAKRPVWAPSESELKHIFTQSETYGELDRDLGSILDAVLDLDDLTIKRVMVPRNKVVSVSEDTDQESLLQFLGTVPYSRVLVYRENQDQVVGFLHKQDIYAWLAVDQARSGRWQTLLRPVSFHLEETPVQDVLRRMRAHDTHIAGIVDEYGGFEGIVTLEDILEEILYNREASDKIRYIRRLDGSWEFAGAASLLDVARVVGFEPADREAETIGGYVARLGGHVTGEIVIDPSGSCEFEVVSGDVSQVHTVRLRPLTSTTPEEPDGIEVSDTVM